MGGTKFLPFLTIKITKGIYSFFLAKAEATQFATEQVLKSQTGSAEPESDKKED